MEAKPKAGGFFGGTKTQSPSQISSKATDSKATTLEAQKKAAEEKRQAALAAAEAKKEAARAAAEARKREAEEKREAARAAAEARKREAEEKREAARAAAEAKKKETEEKRKALAEERKALAEEKRQAAIAAVEAKKREAKSKKQASSQAKQAQKAMETAKPGATISLGFLNFGKSNESQEAPPVQPNGKKSAKKMTSAPRGTPTMYNWRQNRDGSITGKISGAAAYSDGESVTTSPLATDADFGALVETTSGSKYYLAEKGAKIPQTGSATAAPAKTGFSFGSPAKTKSVTPASTKTAFGVGKPQAAAKPPAKKPAPRGVPILSRWRQNRDSSITGLISGSPGFDDGERITTSPIAKGTVAEGQVVQTGSGSRYYLD